MDQSGGQSRLKYPRSHMCKWPSEWRGGGTKRAAMRRGVVLVHVMRGGCVGVRPWRPRMVRDHTARKGGWDDLGRGVDITWPAKRSKSSAGRPIAGHTLGVPGQAGSDAGTLNQGVSSGMAHTCLLSQ